MKKFNISFIFAGLILSGVSSSVYAEVFTGLCSQSPSNGHYDACTNSESACYSKAESDANSGARARCLPGSANNIVVESKRSSIGHYPGTGSSWWDCQVQVRFTCSH